MAKLFVVSNLVLLGAGHLQIVYQSDDDTLLEVEVQGPGTGFSGNWIYPPFARDHATNTPYFGEAGKYKAVEITGHDANALWALFGQLDASFANFGAGINYDFGQNSNSFVNTMLWAAGINLADFRMTTRDISFFPGESANVLLGATTDAGNGTAIAVNVALTAHDDVLHCGIGDDSIGGLTGSLGHDQVWLGAGDDSATGGAGDDVLWGEAGDDSLFGGRGQDVLYAGKGADDLYGGAGLDRFVFLAATEADTGSTPDEILGFQRRDVIDFQHIDANSTLAGDQDFAYSLTGAAAHSIWSLHEGGQQVSVWADIDGDAREDIAIVVLLAHGRVISEANFDL
jgi:Ca2+-binding RTX toxin-like protein